MLSPGLRAASVSRVWSDMVSRAGYRKSRNRMLNVDVEEELLRSHVMSPNVRHRDMELKRKSL